MNKSVIYILFWHILSRNIKYFINNSFFGSCMLIFIYRIMR